MKINKENYEAFLLDLWEGNLSDVQKAELTTFLKDHPELDDGETLALLDDVSITTPEQEFDKELVDFESINEKNYELFFIAYFEGDLSDDEMRSVVAFVDSHPALAKKFDQFRRAKLPAENIIYPYKKDLLNEETPIIPIATRNWLIGVAAASMALFFLVNPFTPENKYDMNGLTQLGIEKHSRDKIQFFTKSQNPTSVAAASTNNVSSFAVNGNSNGYENRTTTKTKIDLSTPNETDPNKKHSISTIKANQLNNIVASINPSLSKENKENQKVNQKIKEEIPTIMELTTAYLQRKKVLNEERKPNLEGLVNNTLASVNKNEQPVLSTSKEDDRKRTVFQLGDFKFERIAKK